MKAHTAVILLAALAALALVPAAMADWQTGPGCSRCACPNKQSCDNQDICKFKDNKCKFHECNECGQETCKHHPHCEWSGKECKEKGGNPPPPPPCKTCDCKKKNDCDYSRECCWLSNKCQDLPKRCNICPDEKTCGKKSDSCKWNKNKCEDK